MYARATRGNARDITSPPVITPVIVDAYESIEAEAEIVAAATAPTVNQQYMKKRLAKKQKHKQKHTTDLLCSRHIAMRLSEERVLAPKPQKMTQKTKVTVAVQTDE